MRRWPLRILLCLILLTGGAITTVAVAWGCAISCQREGFRREMSYLTFHNSPWPAPVPPSWPRLAQEQHEFIALGSTWTKATLDTDEENRFGDKKYIEQCVITVGFPVRCLGVVEGMGWWWGGWVDAEASIIDDAWMTGVFLEDFQCLLPLHPLLGGFVIDTLFYAAIWGGVWFGFVGGKRFIRSKRGRCPRCGYDLRGDLSAGCSECGWNREEGAA